MRGILVAVMLASLMLAGCAGDSGDDGDSDTPTETSETMTDGTSTASGPSTTTGAPRAPVTWDLDVQDNAFAGATLTIQVGDTVRWTQSGSNPHTVTADDGSFDSHPECSGFQDSLLGNCMANGDTFEQTFDTVGDAGYYCRIHGGSGGSGMSGVVTVLDRYDTTPA